MNLSKIVRRMEEIVRLNVVLHQIDAVSDIASILTRQELGVPLTSAYWITRGEGTDLAFGDCIGESFFADNMRKLKGDQSLRGWKIDFTTSEIIEIPSDEFIRTIEELEKVTGKNEERITANNDSELYLNSARFAYVHDELDAFNYSLQQNHYCANTLFNFLTTSDFMGIIADELASYSLERIVFITAATCNSDDKSGYGNDVVEWANKTLDGIPPSVIEHAADCRLNVERETISKYVRDSLIPLMEEAQANNNLEDNSSSEDIERY